MKKLNSGVMASVLAPAAKGGTGGTTGASAGKASVAGSSSGGHAGTGDSAGGDGGDSAAGTGAGLASGGLGEPATGGKGQTGGTSGSTQTAEGGAGSDGDGGASSGGETGGEVTQGPDLIVGSSDHLIHTVRADPAGNLYVGFSRATYTSLLGDISFVSKFDGNLSQKWTLELHDSNWALYGDINDMAVTDDGAVVYTGGTYVSAGDAVIGKVATDGSAIEWEKTWASSGQDVGDAIVVAADGGIYAAGASTGQAPGNPPGAVIQALAVLNRCGCPR